MTQEEISNLNNCQNIILITVDALRWDHLSFNGYNRNTSPTIDAIAADNIDFRNAYSASSHTPEAIPALLTGRYPDVFSDNGYQRVVPTVAELFSGSEVATGAFHSNVHVSRINGYQAGFDEFFDDLYFGQNRWLALAQKFANRFLRSRQTYYARAEEINKHSLRWLDSLPDSQQFFMWNHYMDVHGPYEPLSDYQKVYCEEEVERGRARELFHKAIDDPDEITETERQTLIDLYDAEIRYIDTQLSSFFDALEDRDLLEDSLVILTADHGDAFGEHGYYNHPRQLHSELVHVPFMMSHPSLSSKTVDTTISTLDIVPTLLEIFDVTSEVDLPGIPLQNIISSPTEYENRHVFIQARGESEESHLRRFGARLKNKSAFVERRIEDRQITDQHTSSSGDELLSDLISYSNLRLSDEPEVEFSETGDEDHVINDVDERLEALGYK